MQNDNNHFSFVHMNFTAKQIADFIGGTIEGDENASVCTFAKIEEGKENDLIDRIANDPVFKTTKEEILKTWRQMKMKAQ